MLNKDSYNGHNNEFSHTKFQYYKRGGRGYEDFKVAARMFTLNSNLTKTDISVAYEGL